jgi:hypothetical protein
VLTSLKNLQLRDIIAKPGHMITRSPQKILWFGRNDPDLATKREKRDQVDQAVLNVITDRQGKILSVDAWDGHHRLLGALYGGKQTLGELKDAGLKILINGRDAKGVLQKTTPPAAGVNFRNAPLWSKIDGQDYIRPTRQQSRFADVWINGSVSNWEQGSVFTLQDLLQSNLESPLYTVGVALLKTNQDLNPKQIEKLASLGFQEVLLVPSASADLDEMETALTKLNQDLSSRNPSIRFNLYLEDAGGYISHFGADSFLRRVQETYITRIPPRYVDLQTLSVLPIVPLGYDSPVLGNSQKIISVGWE